ncbi:MAG: glycosyltransferase [Alphaproteobacteria bacterium]|nr:glycosyltransferase [Alphaproteobacteria bacterium]
MLLSICIPTFERAAILAQTLQHLQQGAAGLTGIEIEVSDNASSDATAAVVAAAAAAGPAPIRYWRNPTNLGLLANFTAVLRRGRGRYCVPSCDDDRLDVRAAHAIAQRLAADPASVAYYAPWRAFRPDRGLTPPAYALPFERRSFARADAAELLAVAAEALMLPEIGIFRRDALHAALLPTPGRYWALELMLRLLDHGAVVLGTEGFYVNVAHGAGQESLKSPAREIAEWQASLEGWDAEIAARPDGRPLGARAIRRAVGRKLRIIGRIRRVTSQLLSAGSCLARAGLHLADDDELASLEATLHPLLRVEMVERLLRAQPAGTWVGVAADAWPAHPHARSLLEALREEAQASPIVRILAGDSAVAQALADPRALVVAPDAAALPAERAAAVVRLETLLRPRPGPASGRTGPARHACPPGAGPDVSACLMAPDPAGRASAAVATALHPATVEPVEPLSGQDAAVGAARRARGALCVFLDPQDALDAAALRTAIAMLRDDPRLVAVAAPSLLPGEGDPGGSAASCAGPDDLVDRLAATGRWLDCVVARRDAVAAVALPCDLNDWLAALLLDLARLGPVGVLERGFRRVGAATVAAQDGYHLTIDAVRAAIECALADRVEAGALARDAALDAVAAFTARASLRLARARRAAGDPLGAAGCLRRAAAWPGTEAAARELAAEAAPEIGAASLDAVLAIAPDLQRVDICAEGWPRDGQYGALLGALQRSAAAAAPRRLVDAAQADRAAGDADALVILPPGAGRAARAAAQRVGAADLLAGSPQAR